MSVLEADKVSLYYEYRSPSDPAQSRGETVALLNGVMASASSWEVYAESLTDAGYHVLLHDFRGQLLSGTPAGPYHFNDHRDDFLAICRHLNISRCHLIGTSYGGEIAMRIGVDRPDMVASLVIIDSVSELDALVESFVSSWIALAETRNAELFYKSVLPSLYSRHFLASNREMLAQRAEKMKQLPGEYFSGQIELYRAFLNDVTMTPELSRITAPTLVTCGEEDILKPPRFSRIIAERIPNAQLKLIPRAGHVAVFEAANSLITMIRDFLDAATKHATHG